MKTITIRSNAGVLAQAIAADAETSARLIDQTLERGAIEIARDARQRAPKARTTLTNSIAHVRLATARYEVTAQSRYALAVEEGAGRGGWAPKASLLDWMHIAGVRPRTAGMTMERLADLLQLSIYERGTPAQPFMAPAADAAFPRIESRLSERLQQLVDNRAGA